MSKHRMGRAFVVSSFMVTLLCLGSAQAQSVDEIWKMREKLSLDGLLSAWSAGNDSCSPTQSGKLGGYAAVIIYKVPKAGSDRYVVVLQSNNSDGDGDTGYALINRAYCISAGPLTDNFQPVEPLQVGVLTVPFKMRFSPFALTAGGALGAFVGHKFHHSKDVSSTALVFGSLTNVALNDMNANIPDTKWGFGFGLGWIFTLSGNFQAGVVSGIDLFQGMSAWPYKWHPWLSISIGYSFVTPSKSSAQAALTAQ